jgi:nicotinamidase/pyrazinamidase
MPNPFSPDDIGKLYPARTAEFMAAGQEIPLQPSSKDDFKTLLLLVDMQIDFIHPEGTLKVDGALDDTLRLIWFIYKNTRKITTIAASLDSHVPQMIFFPCWWINQKGEHPLPYTTITLEDVIEQRWIPLYHPGWSKVYVQELHKARNKKLLTIWPYHTIIGTVGHLLVPSLSEAITYHAAARSTNPIFINKGFVPEVEHYGIFAPEVHYYGVRETAVINRDLLNGISEYDRVIIAGEAKSHCVLETIWQLVRLQKRKYHERIFVLTDCMSSVKHPEIDFEAQTNDEFEKLKGFGITFTHSLSPDLNI